MRLCPWSLVLASSIPVLGLERVCPRKGCPWPWFLALSSTAFLKNSILHHNQHGFRSGLSTSHTLLGVVTPVLQSRSKISSTLTLSHFFSSIPTPTLTPGIYFRSTLTPDSDKILFSRPTLTPLPVKTFDSLDSAPDSDSATLQQTKYKPIQKCEDVNNKRILLQPD